MVSDPSSASRILLIISLVICALYYMFIIIRQCSARFLSAGELKGHQVMHTGDRKFPCRFCERAYVNYSGRLRHERTHTNERPFVCTQCGKGFTNSYILKNHMLVHTGERMFRKVNSFFISDNRLNLLLYFLQM